MSTDVSATSPGASPMAAPAMFERVMVTGHRPKGLTPAEGAWAQLALARVAHRCATAYGTRVAISGMALGADTWWAISALSAGLDLHAFIPFLDQPTTWPLADQLLWRQLRVAATREVIVSGEKYDPRDFHARNDAMLAEADLVIALYKPGSGGGTASTVEKAEGRKLPVLLLDPAAGTVTAHRFAPAPRTRA